jgi:hypothetical protein
MSLSNYPSGCDASDYEAWAGTDCVDESPYCDDCGAELDNGFCQDCEDADEVEEDDDD